MATRRRDPRSAKLSQQLGRGTPQDKPPLNRPQKRSRSPVPGVGIQAAVNHPCEQDEDNEQAGSTARKADSKERHQRKECVPPKKTRKHAHLTGYDRTGFKTNTKWEYNCPTKHIRPGEKTGPRKRWNYRKKDNSQSLEENPRARPERLEPGQKGCIQKRTDSSTCTEPQPRASIGQPESPSHTMRDQNWNRLGQKAQQNQGHNTGYEKKRGIATNKKKKRGSSRQRPDKRGKETYNHKTKATSLRARTRKGNHPWGNARKTRKPNPDTPAAVNRDHEGDTTPKKTGGKGGDTDRSAWTLATQSEKKAGRERKKEWHHNSHTSHTQSHCE
ncbi:hypothetical protein NDU88_004095 [Pleurodeles waltl]|uniref:Uncharacterized protein n=1 Tax=Pleurodeles waltl TaxID=8319 RepID=A0AAV7QAW6_PLEWA|nr:hypothetical protein NDU88_004095 [Pleurodeles waltl]